jgi:hypothetical protein
MKFSRIDPRADVECLEGNLPGEVCLHRDSVACLEAEERWQGRIQEEPCTLLSDEYVDIVKVVPLAMMTTLFIVIQGGEADICLVNGDYALK